MRKSALIPGILCLFTSCVTVHKGTINSSTLGRNVSYEDIACGVSQTNKYFWLGGNSQDAVVLEAKRELIKNRPLNANEEYANFTVDFKNTYWPFYMQTKVTMSADVVKYGNDTTRSPFTDNYRNKLVGSSISNELFSVGDAVVNTKLEAGTIISFESDDIVRVLYKTGKDNIRTKKISIYKIYSTEKSYNDFKAGDYFIYTEVVKEIERTIPTKVVAVGLKTLIVKDTKNMVIDYKK